MSAPATDPAPEQESSIVKVVGPRWKTSLANTGKKVSTGIARAVIRNAKAISADHCALIAHEPDALLHAGQYRLACGLRHET